MMKIQFVSDLHLEFRTKKVQNILTPSAPILCMVGDICACGSLNNFNKLINFLNIFHDKFEAILHISGNHEYYTDGSATPKELAENTIICIDKKLKNLSKTYPNYHYLNNSTWEYVDKKTKKYFVFVGTTLWSYIPLTLEIIELVPIKPDAKETKSKSTKSTKLESKKKTINLHDAVEKRMNDYNYIYMSMRDPSVKISYRQYTVEDMQKKHKTAVAFLKRTIAAAKNTKKTYILLTHHKPLFDRATDERDEYTYAYESDLADKLLVPPFTVAAHGHTHIHYDKKINNVRVISNPKGYPEQDTGFIDTFTVAV